MPLTNLPPPNTHLNIVESYLSQHRKKAIKQTIIVIDYKAQGMLTQQEVIAPISLASGKKDFPALLDVMNRLNKTPYNLYEISLLNVTLKNSKASKPISFEKANLSQIQHRLSEQQDAIVKSGRPLSPLKDAQAQLQLIEFFMHHRFRDAAYLAVDNAKADLAKASAEKTIDKDTLKTLSKSLEELETRLRRDMPFAL